MSDAENRLLDLLYAWGDFASLDQKGRPGEATKILELYQAVATDGVEAVIPRMLDLIRNGVPGAAIPPHANARAHEIVMDRLREMTPDEIMAVAVKVGIYDEHGALTKEYGGALGDVDELAPRVADDSWTHADSTPIHA